MELKVQNVFKSFGEKEVLRDISISAHSGTALGLLGRNGAGKTTTIRIIMGVFFADKGEVLIDGKQIDRDHIRIGYHSSGECPQKMLRRPVTGGLKEWP